MNRRCKGRRRRANPPQPSRCAWAEHAQAQAPPLSPAHTHACLPRQEGKRSVPRPPLFVTFCLLRYTSHPQSISDEQLRLVHKTVKARLSTQYANIHSAFRALDRDGSGTISPEVGQAHAHSHPSPHTYPPQTISPDRAVS